MTEANAPSPPPVSPPSPALPSPSLSSYRRVRRRVHDILMSPESEKRDARWVNGVLSLVILANLLLVVIETVPAIGIRMAGPFRVAEVISVLIFTVEYCLRVWSSVDDPRYARPVVGRLRFMATFFVIVDLVAVLPFFAPHFGGDLRFLRGVRLIRLVRVFKLVRNSAGFSMYGRILRRKREELVASMALLGLLLLLVSCAMYFLESEAQPQQFSSIPAAMWWGIVTLTTIGYGDVVPITAWGRVFGALISVIGLGFVALPSAILVGGMMEQMELKKKQAAEASSTQVRTVEDTAPEPDQPGNRACPHCGRRPSDPVEPEAPRS